MLNRLFFRRHLEEDEAIAMVVHKHWLLGLKALFWPTLSFVLSWWVLWIAVEAGAARGAIVLVAAWATGSLVFWLRNFFDYFLDAWVITNHGIIDVAWHGWFHRESSRVLYSDIQGVSYEINGVWSTLLRYGAVSIEKISTGSAISLENVPRPRRVETTILQNMETYLTTKNLKDSKHVQELLAAMVAEQINLKAINPSQHE